ncbi:MAG: hypothetical protein WBD27_09920 [Pyrinomonadaceae bacterium]
MERKYNRIDFTLGVALVASFCLVLFLCGFYLGFSETYELNRIKAENIGIRLSGGSNPYFERSLIYGFVATLLIASLLIGSYKRIFAKIVRASVLLISLFPVWVLFISTPAGLSGNGKMASSGLNFILYLDLSVLPIVVLLLFLCLRGAWHFSTHFRERTIIE